MIFSALTQSVCQRQAPHSKTLGYGESKSSLMANSWNDEATIKSAGNLFVSKAGTQE